MDTNIETGERNASATSTRRVPLRRVYCATRRRAVPAEFAVYEEARRSLAPQGQLRRVQTAAIARRRRRQRRAAAKLQAGGTFAAERAALRFKRCRKSDLTSAPLKFQIRSGAVGILVF